MDEIPCYVPMMEVRIGLREEYKLMRGMKQMLVTLIIAHRDGVQALGGCEQRTESTTQRKVKQARENFWHHNR